MALACLNCGQPFETRRIKSGGKPERHCSDKCRRAYAQQAFLARRRATRPTECAECGKPLVQPAWGRPRRFCSDECKQRAGNRALNRRRLPIRDQDPQERLCAYCGKPFIPQRRNQMYCLASSSSYCTQKAYQQRKAAGMGPLMVEHTVKCDECGREFIAKHPAARWCSQQCGHRWQSRTHARRRGPVAAEPYTDRQIFERDEWRCHICGQPVRYTTKRTDPEGATIDHIIPISLGGPDVPSNVATAHNRCNREKRALVRPADLAAFLAKHHPDLIEAELKARGLVN